MTMNFKAYEDYNPNVPEDVKHYVAGDWVSSGQFAIRMTECDSKTFYGPNYIHGRNTKYKDDYFGINVDVFDRMMETLAAGNEVYMDSYKTNSMHSVNADLIATLRDDGIVHLTEFSDPFFSFKFKVDENKPKGENGMPWIYSSNEPTDRSKKDIKISYVDLVKLHAACHVELTKQIKMWSEWWARTPEERRQEIDKWKLKDYGTSKATAEQDGSDGDELCGKNHIWPEIKISELGPISF